MSAVIPDALCDLPQWLVWRSEQARGRSTKVPRCALDPTRRASSTDPTTWSDYATAVNAATIDGVDGIGFIVTEGDPICGVDLDNCVEDGRVHESALALVERLGSYTEVSPSGNGLRVFLRAGKPGTRCKREMPWGGAIEVYDRERFFTVTGHHLPGTPATVEGRQVELDALYDELFPAEDAPTEPPARARVVSKDDEELLERANAAANGAKFSALWAGDTSIHGGDHSSADLELCSLLAFWTGGDAGRIDRLFRRSGLMRPKWDERRPGTTYGRQTIERALSGSAQGYDENTEMDPFSSLLPPKPISVNGNGHDSEVVVVPAPTTRTTTTARYEGRHVDLAPLLAAPPRPIPWRVGDLVADGTVTILAGGSGSGKSWLAQALCTGVARGEPVAGLPCTKGAALYVDGEMGPEMFVNQRLRPTGIAEPEFGYIDAMGLDVSKAADLRWLQGEIEKVGASLVVIDSLRRLAPSKAENDSDDMAPTVAAVAKLARDTGAALLLIHHKGDSEKYFRGSTAIKDQADALFALLREGQRDDDEGDDDGVRRLRCRGGKGKMRYSREPPDVYLTIAPEEGGVAAADRPNRAWRSRSMAPTREAVKQGILEALPAKMKTEVAVALQRPINDRTFKEAWAELGRAGAIVKDGGRWVVVVRSLGGTTTTSQEIGEPT